MAQTATAGKPSLGEIMRAVRHQRRVSATQVAAAVGVDKNSVLMWESGRSVPLTPHFAAWCRVMGVSADEVFRALDDTPGYRKHSPWPSTPASPRRLAA
jgi:transcriptional regulator with XRE-family HTH domain